MNSIEHVFLLKHKHEQFFVSITPVPCPLFSPNFLRFQHVTSSRSD